MSTREYAVITGASSGIESVSAEFARPTKGATKISAVVAITRVRELPYFAADFPTGPSATKTPSDIIRRDKPRTELESSSMLFKSGMRDTKFPALKPRQRKERVTPR